MTKAIAFDMGGVLLDLDLNAAIEAFRTIACFETIDEYLDSYFQKGFLKDLEEGLLSEEEGYEEFFRHCSPGTTKDDIIKCYVAFIQGMDTRKAEILKTLHSRFPLYLLSNNNVIAFEHVCKGIFANHGVPVDQIFKAQFNSFQMKIMKPAPEMYERVIAGIGCNPEEIIFLDDSQKNVDGAKALGIDARLYRSIEDMEALLELPPVIR